MINIHMERTALTQHIQLIVNPERCKSAKPSFAHNCLELLLARAHTCGSHGSTTMFEELRSISWAKLLRGWAAVEGFFRMTRTGDSLASAAMMASELALSGWKVAPKEQITTPSGAEASTCSQEKDIWYYRENKLGQQINRVANHADACGSSKVEWKNAFDRTCVAAISK
jgi:hypothetical protein